MCKKDWRLDDSTLIQRSVELTATNTLEGGESLLVSERKRV